MNAIKSTLILLALVGLSGCLSGAGPAGTTLQPKSWGYQLQDADPDTLAAAGFDLVVIDYSRDGSAAGRYTRAEIEEIANSGTIPIAYISIGEAEDYRFYWQEEWKTDPPAWLGRGNPDWDGNYKVRYWDPGWKGIVYSYLDKIISQGFAGLYLDIVDAFEYWSDPDNGEPFHLSEKEAAQRMIRFVEEIAAYCRKVHPGFYIIPQNGERILDYDDGSFLNAISAIGIEDLFYDETERIPASAVEYRLGYLERIARAGRPVLVVDYVDDGTGYVGKNRVRIDAFRAACRAHGFVPYAARADRALDELNVIPGVQPICNER
ncbi:hypothetical protein DRJ23_02555 [Candidatus Acetothermia bacterium]|nr:MAG: hypothetical protein DRJ23_02555 [Candidatus Acetothermia bacterium]